MKFLHTRLHSMAALLSLGTIVCYSIIGFGQVQMTEIPTASQILEPGANQAMSSPSTLGDGAVAFSFEVEDVDPLANDSDAPKITCVLVQNLGTATSSDIAQVGVLDQATSSFLVAPHDDDGLGSPTPVGCPTGAPGGSNIAWEAFFPVSTTIPDNPLAGRIFEVAVRVDSTSSLINQSQNHTVMLRVTIQFEEKIGSPPILTTFTNSLTDGSKDFVWNGGINRFQAQSFSPAPIRIGGDPGVVARFQICDDDANAHELRLENLLLAQGPLGNAVIDDLQSFVLYKINGTVETWGEINSSDGSWSSQFNRGGVGIPLDVDGPFSIPDDECYDFEIQAKTSDSAMKGRNVHLRITFQTEEPTGFPLDVSVAPSLQISSTIMLGSGVLRIPDLQITGIESQVPIEVVGFPQPGLGRLEIQNNAIQFDPAVVHVEDVLPMEPYQIEDLSIDNREGRLTFTLLIDPAQSSSAKIGIPEPESVAFMKLSGQGKPGQRSTLLFQTDLIENASGDDITDGVLVISGSIALLTPGDVDLLDGVPTVSDALILAYAILSCPEEITGLSDEQKRLADVAPPQAEPGEVPTCNELTSADVAEIAEMAITFRAASLHAALSSPSNRTTTLLPRMLAVQSLRLYPTMSHWKLHIEGQGIASVSLEGFDLTGRKRFEVETSGTRLQWAGLDENGRRLANGVYLYIVTVHGIYGEVWHSTLRKMIVLR